MLGKVMKYETKGPKRAFKEQLNKHKKSQFIY